MLFRTVKQPLERLPWWKPLVIRTPRKRVLYWLRRLWVLQW